MLRQIIFLPWLTSSCNEYTHICGNDFKLFKEHPLYVYMICKRLSDNNLIFFLSHEYNTLLLNYTIYGKL